MPRKTRCDPRRGAAITRCPALSAEEVVDDQVDQLDADEGGDDPAEAIDPEVTPQQRTGPDWPVAYAAQRQRDQQRDDDRVEDDRRHDRRARRAETHDVQDV